MEDNFFVVVSSPRCGSNYVCSLLGSHPQVVCHNEIFHHEAVGVHTYYLPHNTPLTHIGWRDANPAKFVENLLADTFLFSPKVKLVGCKMLMNEDQPEKGLEAILALKPRIILLTRENKLAWFSSIAIAGVTQEWVTQKKTRSHTKIVFSEVDYNNRVNDQLVIENKILARLAVSGLPILKIDYDELVHAYSHLQILEFLQLPIRKLKSTTHKQNADSLLDRFTNPETIVTFAAAMGKSAWVSAAKDPEKEALHIRVAGLMREVAQQNTSKAEQLVDVFERVVTKAGFKRPLRKFYRLMNLLKFQLR